MTAGSTIQALHEQIVRRTSPRLWWTPPDGWLTESRLSVVGLLPGSFNPLHHGHLSLRKVAADRLGGTVAAELSIVNADKPELSAAEVEQRCLQFTAHPVVVTAAATFLEKSRLFPGTTFVVGADTAARVVSPRFYRGDGGLMDAALNEIRSRGCSFLVAARRTDERVLVLNDLAIPRAHRRLFAEIPADEFQVDVSSTELRGRP